MILHNSDTLKILKQLVRYSDTIIVILLKGKLAKDIIRHFNRKCIKCCKIKVFVTNQMIGDLPPSATFLRVGVDYAGPFLIKSAKGRRCFSTWAIHLELVSDLSAEAFIAALKRFVSCRGKSSDTYSDCRTNFIESKRIFTEFEKLAKSNKYNEYVSNHLIDIGINW